ncbi:MAG: ankyrin repeat domain-containing protein, partial [Alphaproteobacteria bacterium]|nr:ankyrin repeat domain-containing protein [Alphaproteobacteria bacterium]
DWDKTWGKVDWAKDTDTDILKKIENFDVNLERPDGYKNTPLMYAINFKKLETAKYLIDKNADVNHKNSMGFTPLMAAAIKGHTQIVQKLLDAGANVNIARQGRTALDMAKNYGHEDIANLLTAGIKKLSILTKFRRNGR